MKYMLKVLFGVGILCLGFYLMYFGSEMDSGLLVFAGILVALGGSVIIYIYRHKHNMKLIYNYKKSIEDLGKDPDNQEIINLAYKHGKEYYMTRSGGAMLTSKEKKVLDRDILYARGKLEE